MEFLDVTSNIINLIKCNNISLENIICIIREISEEISDQDFIEEILDQDFVEEFKFFLDNSKIENYQIYENLITPLLLAFYIEKKYEILLQIDYENDDNTIFKTYSIYDVIGDKFVLHIDQENIQIYKSENKSIVFSTTIGKIKEFPFDLLGYKNPENEDFNIKYKTLIDKIITLLS